MAVGTSMGDEEIWDVDSQSKLRTIKSHTTRIPSLSWSNHILTSGSQSGIINHNDVRIAKSLTSTLISHSSEVCGLEWRADGQMLASGGNDNMVYLNNLGSLVGL